MKNFIIYGFILIFLTACGTKNISKNNHLQDERIVLLELGDQNLSSLPKIDENIAFSGDELLKKRFRVYELKRDDKEMKDPFWAFSTYKYSVNKPRYGVNFRPLNKEWYDKHKINANVSKFLSVSKIAVTTANTSHRNFPTSEPMFYNPNTPGEGYPFDYLQNSILSIGFVLFVSHFSKDGAWAFVRDDDVWGWVKADDIKILSQKEAQDYKNSKFLTITNDNTPVYDESGDFLFYARVGGLLPYFYDDDSSFKGKIYTRSGLKVYKISKKHAFAYPLKFNQNNIEKVAKTLMSQPYGWGGMSELRDCSLMIKDFMSGFGIWLPRNSFSQAQQGCKIMLEGLNNDEKLSIIKQKAIAYRTLIHLPGHIMLYVGVRNNDVMVLHQSWGLKTKSNGRAMIGQTAITPIDIGKDKDYIDEQSLLISKAKSITILDTKRINDKILRLKHAYGVEVVGDYVSFDSGKKELFDDGKIKSLECENGADIEDMLGEYAALKPLSHAPSDVGRCRNYTLLGEIYGKNEANVMANLVDVVWLRDFVATKVKFNSKNGASKALQNVSDELNEMAKSDPSILEFLTPLSGTFKWRNIAKTTRLSTHSYAIAIDINVAKSHYWQWHEKRENLIPEKIVHVFEKHGFIWGGRWEHFDTMHFEYRPELAFVK
ncbi:SH3 domain-containing protein [Campylobacter majalis]|uniref:SH3 domain-containing protein n=1 Tax=Campylobacter majalis TaxID=2790656 RepID=UPI003D68154C